MTVPMTRGVVRTIAVDYDGTVARDGRLSHTAAEALDEARRAGLSLVLVTGRILEELAHAAPGISDRFDVIVAENGAVALRHGHVVRLAEPVDDALVQELTRLGTGVRRGQVIAALSGSRHSACGGGHRTPRSRLSDRDQPFRAHDPPEGRLKGEWARIRH